MTLFVTRLAELPVGARSFLYASDGLKNDLTRKDMTHSVISIDSIILNSMSTDSSAVIVLDS